MPGIRNLTLGIDGDCVIVQITSPLLVVNAVGRKDAIPPVCKDGGIKSARDLCTSVGSEESSHDLQCGTELPTP